MIIFAKIITFFLHPVVLVSPAVFLVVLGSGSSFEQSLIWSAVSLLFVVAISLYILAGVKMGFFTNFDVSKREQRVYLFPVIILAGIVFLYCLIHFNGPKSLLFALIYFIISVFILALVTLKIKASIHVGAITAAIVSAIYFFGQEYAFILVLIPIMAWARIREKRHTLKETVVGFIMGLLLAMLGIFGVQYFM